MEKDLDSVEFGKKEFSKMLQYLRIENDTLIIDKEFDDVEEVAMRCDINIFEIDLSVLKNAFKNYCENNGIKHIKFEEGSKFHCIMDAMFSGMDFLESIDFSNCKELNIFGTRAFMSCKNLKSVSFAGCSELKAIGNSAFEQCKNLEFVDISNCSKITLLDDFAFHHCENLKSVKWDGVENLEIIGTACFENCFKLDNVDLSVFPKLTQICDYAFGHCFVLSNLKMPTSPVFEAIGKFGFVACHNLWKVDLSNSTIKLIGLSSFRDCPMLRYFDLSNCKNLREFNSGILYMDKLSVFDMRGTTNINLWGHGYNKITTEKAYFSYDLEGHSVNPRFTDVFPDGTKIEVLNRNNTALNFTVGESEYSDYKMLSLNNLRQARRLKLDYDLDFIGFFNAFKELENASKIYDRLNEVADKVMNGITKTTRNDCLSLFRILGLFGVEDSNNGKGFDAKELNVYKNLLAKDYLAHKLKVDVEKMRKFHKEEFAPNHNGSKDDYMNKMNIILQQKTIEIEKKFTIEELILYFIENNIANHKDKDKLLYEMSLIYNNDKINLKFAEFLAYNFNAIMKNKLVKDSVENIAGNENEDFVEQSIDGKIRLIGIFNRFENILGNNKSKSVITRKKNDRLTLDDCEYRNIYLGIKEGNEELAELCGNAHIEQKGFDHLQVLFESGKAIASHQVLTVTPDDSDSEITYSFIEKDNPIGLVLGNITNCCQCYGNVGQVCMEVGETHTHSGFITLNYKGNIIGQSWVWYNSFRDTIALDNIEVPDTFDKLVNGEKKEEVLRCLERLCDNFYNTMKDKGYKIDNVIIGSANTDIKALEEEYYKETDEAKMIGCPYSTNYNKKVYTDIVKDGQYIVYRDGKKFDKGTQAPTRIEEKIDL